MLPPNWRLDSMTGIGGGHLNDLVALIENDTKGRVHCNDTVYVAYHACNELSVFEKEGTGNKKKTKIRYSGITDEVLAGADRSPS